MASRSSDPQGIAAPSEPAGRRGRARESRRQTRERIVAAATELVRRRPYGEVSVDQVMREAGIGRTIFYRHFDDLGSLLLRAEPGRDRRAIRGAAQRSPRPGRTGPPDAVRRALEAGVEVYRRQGPLLRAVREAAAADQLIAQGYAATLSRFDELAEEALRAFTGDADAPPADVAADRAGAQPDERELPRRHLRRGSRGHPPRPRHETLTEIWEAVVQSS